MKSLFRYAAETRGFIVRVSVSFLPEQSEVGKGRWFWAYHIRIENEGLMAAQLLTRHWDIRDANGAHHLVDGEGVVGEQPVIKPGGAYDYVSGCPLTTPNCAPRFPSSRWPRPRRRAERRAGLTDEAHASAPEWPARP